MSADTGPATVYDVPAAKMGSVASLSSRLLDAILPAGRPRPPLARRLVVLVLGLVAITAWQRNLAAHPERIDATYRITGSSGAHHEKTFFFFRYHLGLYPLAVHLPVRADTKNEAERLLRVDPSKLYQEEGLTFRSGDHGHVHLFYVDKWLGGDARTPSLKPANTIGFILALNLLFLSAWWVDWTFLGAVLVLFFGSNPLQLYAAYVQENYFSWPITALVLMLAIHLPLLVERPRARWLFVAAVLTGVLLTGIRTWRSEPAVLLLSACATYALASGVARRHRVIAIAIAIATFAAGDKLYVRGISSLVADTKKQLHDVGAAPYEGPTVFHHEFWHAVWCGLGDFDTEKGHVWDDRKAYAAALPVLEAHAGRKLPLDPNRWFQDETIAGDPRYHVAFFEYPGYHEAIRGLVLDDVRSDPVWYARILAKRARRLLTEVTPIDIALTESKPSGTSTAFAWIALPLALVLHRVRRGFLTKLILFPLPLVILPIAVYSGGGLVLYSSFHLVAAAVVVLLVAEGMRARLARIRRGSAA